MGHVGCCSKLMEHLLIGDLKRSLDNPIAKASCALGRCHLALFFFVVSMWINNHSKSGWMLISWVIISQILTNDIFGYIWMLPSGVNMENPPVSSRMLQLWTSNCVRGFALFFLKGIGFSSCTYYPCYCTMYLPTCLVTFPGKCSGTMVIFPWMIGGVYWFSFPIKMQILWWVW